jgi:hypothetical protein
MLQTAHTFEHTPKNQKTRKSLFINELRDNFVVPPGIEPGTQGFSVLCSTN